jgi:hypothetical protein
MTITMAENQPPVAVAEADVTAGLAPLTVNFDASQSYDPEGQTIAYDWDTGDGESELGIATSHLYLVPGTFIVTLRVFDIFNDVGTDTSQITVIDPPAFKLESSVFNAGGHPDDGTILAPPGYRRILDALGDATGAVALGSTSWRMEAGHCNIYNGDTCVPPALNQTMTTITATPGSGGLFTYLVTVDNALGEEGTRGYRSDDSERPNPNACP